MTTRNRCYKLTDEHGRTWNDTQWGPGVRRDARVTQTDLGLCSDGWIHFYDDPILGLLLNPTHAKFESPRVWEAEYHGERLNDRGLKSGAKGLTTVREITSELPKITTEMRVRFGIFCAGLVSDDPQWQEWAARWLSGEDRSAVANVATYNANAAYAAASAAYAAHANAAANAAYAAASAAYAAHANAAANAANAADYAADYTDIDLIACAHEAVYGILGT